MYLNSGMDERHSYAATFTINEHLMEKRRHHMELLRMRRAQQNQLGMNKTPSSSENEEEDSEEESDSEMDDFSFLQPVSTRMRRILLRNSGIRKIESTEKEECRDIRVSRERCGCDCKSYCEPETCGCSQAGIKCQVDRMSFPCGCTKDGCGNLNGRIEFNPIRVRTHFIHTLMRIEMEKKHAEQQVHGTGAAYDDARINCSNYPPENEHSMFMNQYKQNCMGVYQDPTYSTTVMTNGHGANRGTTMSDGYYSTTAINCNQPMHTMQADTHVPHISSQTHGHQLHGGVPRVLLFNDSDDEFHHSENPTNIYDSFHHEESSSYSESSEGSVDSPTMKRKENNSAEELSFHSLFNEDEPGAPSQDFDAVDTFGTSDATEEFSTNERSDHAVDFSTATTTDSFSYTSGITTLITEASHIVNSNGYDLPSTIQNGSLYPSCSDSGMIYSVASNQDRSHLGYTDSLTNDSYQVSDYKSGRLNGAYSRPPQVENKYTELTSASCKLEPISELLTPPMFSTSVPSVDSGFRSMVTNANSFEVLHSAASQDHEREQEEQYTTYHDFNTHNTTSFAQHDSFDGNTGEFNHSAESYMNSQPYSLNQKLDHQDSASSEDSLQETTNFGEIIKKSLVETVSA